MCKMCNTKAQKTLEILTNLNPTFWPGKTNFHCTPSSPCDYIKRLPKGAPRRHADRLEYASATASAEYEPRFCQQLATAIMKHHNIEILSPSAIQRAERAKKRGNRQSVATETAT